MSSLREIFHLHWPHIVTPLVQRLRLRTVTASLRFELVNTRPYSFLDREAEALRKHANLILAMRYCPKIALQKNK